MTRRALLAMLALAVAHPERRTRRQEALSMLREFRRTWPPELLKVGADIILRNSDLPSAQELADRLQKAKP